MQNFLEYRPRLGYKRDLQAVLRGSDNVSGRELEQFLDTARQRGYEPSQAIVEALEATPADVLKNLVDAKATIEQTTNQIVDCLRHKLAIGVSVDDYIKGRQLNDIDVVAAFEDYHSLNIAGSTQAESLPVLFDLIDELSMLIEFADKQFFGGKADLEDLEQAKQKEQEYLRYLISQDEGGQIDLAGLSEENHLKEYLRTRAAQIVEFVKELEAILSSKLNDMYGNQISNVVSAIISAPTLLDQMKLTTEARFGTNAVGTDDVRNRMQRSVSRDHKLALLQKLVAFQELKVKNSQMLDWMEQVSPEDSINALNLFFYDMIAGVETVNVNSDKLVADLYRVTELDRFQLEDYASALYAKKSSRDTHSLLTQIQDHFDFDDKDVAKQVERFVRNQKLETPGSLCG